MEENEKKNSSWVAAVIGLLFAARFCYKGVHYLMIGYDMTTSGILLLVCGVVLIAGSLFMLFRKSK